MVQVKIGAGVLLLFGSGTSHRLSVKIEHKTSRWLIVILFWKPVNGKGKECYSWINYVISCADDKWKQIQSRPVVEWMFSRVVWENKRRPLKLKTRKDCEDQLMIIVAQWQVVVHNSYKRVVLCLFCWERNILKGCVVFGGRSRAQTRIGTIRRFEFYGYNRWSDRAITKLLGNAG